MSVNSMGLEPMTAGAIGDDLIGQSAATRFDGCFTTAAAARRFVRRSMGSCGASTAMIEDAQLAVSELLANAVEHGRAEGVEIVLCKRAAERWELEVIGGQAALWVVPRSPQAWELSDSSEVSGRGLGLVRHLLSDVEVVDVHGITRVTGAVLGGRLREVERGTGTT